MAPQRRTGSDQEAAQHVGDARGSSRSPDKRVADWAFWGYFAVAVSALLFQVAQDHRFARSVARARLCVAQLDSTCVSRELEAESAIRKGDPYTELATASLGLLLHRPSSPAQVTADHFEAAQNANAATPAERADVLLLRADIAIAGGDLKRARESVDAARALLGESELTLLRKRRIDAAESDVASRNTNGVEALRQAFERLFEAADEGNRALYDVRQAACNDWIARVTDTGARRQLLLAVQSAGRANSGRYPDPSWGSYHSPSNEPPTPPSRSGYDYTYGSGSFDDRMARYRERLARYEKEQAAVRERDNQRASEASATKQAALDQAKEALAAGIAALSALPTPFADAPSAARPAAPVWRSDE